jgi:hypothetical protein
LIAVIPGAEIAVPEDLCHCDLRQFLSVTKNPKFRLAHENFPASDQTRLSAFYSQAVISQDLSYFSLGIFCLYFFGRAQDVGV